MNAEAAGTTGLAVIDLVILAVYLIGMLVIGTHFGRYIKSADDLFLAGKSLPFWAVGMSIVVTDISATDFIAVAGGTYRYGIAQANFDWLGSMPALLIAAFVFVPFYWRSGAFTIPEFLGRRYGTVVRTFLAVAWGLIVTMTLGIMLHATAVLFRGVLGWPVGFSIAITTIVVGIYTLTGGLAAVVMTDVLQLVVMFVGGTALVVRALWEVGGLAALREGVLARGPEFSQHFDLYLPHDTTTPFPWTGIVLGLGIVLSTAYFSGNQVVVQRALGARSEWDAKAGVLLAGMFKLFIPVLVAIPGLAALLIVPGLENPDDAVPSLIRLLLPPGLRGLMFAAFLAALMSSVDSALNSASTLWTEDVIAPLRRARGKPLDERQRVLAGRVLGAVILITSALLAPQVEQRFTNIYNAIQTVFSFVQGPTLAILLLGLLWRRANRWGAMAGLGGGVALAIVLNSPLGDGVFTSEEPFLFVAWWTFVFALVLTVLVSLLTPPEPEERLRGLVWRDALRDENLQAKLRARIP